MRDGASPQLGKRGFRGLPVGNGQDYEAEVTNPLSSVEGSFDQPTVTSGVTGTQYGPSCTIKGTNVANAFALQLNSKPFKNPTTNALCSGAGSVMCSGWQQFIFENENCIDSNGKQRRLHRYSKLAGALQ